MTSKQIKLWSAGIAAADAVLTMGDKAFPIGVPGWITSSWPFVFMGVYAFDRFAHAMIEPDTLPAHEHAETTTVTPPHVP